jgi:biopolymer transport protein ExbD
MRTDRINKPKSPQLDMNPMVDMAFLLVTFFLLATTFKVPEPATVILPRAVVTENLPEKELITITVTNDGRAFIGINTFELREQWLRSFATTYNLELSTQQIETFSMLSGFGVPANELTTLLDMRPEERNRTRQKGIPVDSLNNQLADWLIFARVVEPRARVAIKSDKGTPYKYINKVVKTLTDNNVLRFNLITDIRRLND